MTGSIDPAAQAPRAAPLWQRALPWLVTLLCFAYLYLQIDRQAAREGSSALPFLARVFADVDWGRWLLLMIPYSVFFFLVAINFLVRGSRRARIQWSACTRPSASNQGLSG